MRESGYGADLAAVHHEDYGWAATGASEVLHAELKRRRVDDGLVVDLGCGTGILAARMTALGYDVLGVDFSDAMLRIARRAAPAARFKRASVVDFEPPPCVAVTAIGEVLNYRFDERVSLRSIEAAFRRVYRALAPGGIFLFDLSGPGRGGPDGFKEQIRDRDGYFMHFQTREDRRRKLLVREQRLFVRTGRHYRRADERHILQLIEPERATGMLEKVGFRVRRLTTYPGGPKLAGWCVFVASKPKR